MAYRKLLRWTNEHQIRNLGWYWDKVKYKWFNKNSKLLLSSSSPPSFLTSQQFSWLSKMYRVSLTKLLSFTVPPNTPWQALSVTASCIRIYRPGQRLSSFPFCVHIITIIIFIIIIIICTDLDSPSGLQKVGAPRNLDSQHIEVARFSALITNHFYPQGHGVAGKIPWPNWESNLWPSGF